MTYKKLVPSSSPDQKYDLVEIDKEEYIAQCFVELVEQGIDEDRHRFGHFWQELKPASIKEMLEDESSLDKMLQYAKKDIKEMLSEVLEDLER